MKISVCTPLNVENISSRRNSFGLGPHFWQQNEHMSVKKDETYGPHGKLLIVSRILCVLNIP